MKCFIIPFILFSFLLFSYPLLSQNTIQEEMQDVLKEYYKSKKDTTKIDLSFTDSIKIPPVKIEQEVEKEQFVFCGFDEVPAKFEGGMDSLYKLINHHLQFPEDAKEGKVFFHFVVDTMGKMTNLEILKSPSEANSAEVLRVMNLISKDHYWTPATQRGKKVKVRMAMPVVFRKSRKNK